MKEQPPSNANPNKAPVLEDANPMPNTTQESVPMTPAMTAVAQAVRFDPYDRPIEFSEFEAKYGIGSPDNLGMDRVSFGESFKAYEDYNGHGFRRIFVTSLVNDAGVNTEEVL